jgi:hypothetical protein
MVKGGACYVLDDERNCSGNSTVTCDTQPCKPGSNFCPSRYIDVKKGNRYFAGSENVENGGTTTIIEIDVQCYVRERCGTYCFPSITAGVPDHCQLNSTNEKIGVKKGKSRGPTGC